MSTQRSHFRLSQKSSDWRTVGLVYQIKKKGNCVINLSLRRYIMRYFLFENDIAVGDIFLFMLSCKIFITLWFFPPSAFGENKNFTLKSNTVKLSFEIAKLVNFLPPFFQLFVTLELIVRRRKAWGRSLSVTNERDGNRFRVRWGGREAGKPKKVCCFYGHRVDCAWKVRNDVARNGYWQSREWSIDLGNTKIMIRVLFLVPK